MINDIDPGWAVVLATFASLYVAVLYAILPHTDLDWEEFGERSYWGKRRFLLRAFFWPVTLIVHNLLSVLRFFIVKPLNYFIKLANYL